MFELSSLGVLMITNTPYEHMQKVDVAIMNFHYFVSMLTCIEVNAYEWSSLLDNVFINLVTS